MAVENLSFCFKCSIYELNVAKLQTLLSNWVGELSVQLAGDEQNEQRSSIMFNRDKERRSKQMTPDPSTVNLNCVSISENNNSAPVEGSGSMAGEPPRIGSVFESNERSIERDKIADELASENWCDLACVKTENSEYLPPSKERETMNDRSPAESNRENASLLKLIPELANTAAGDCCSSLTGFQTSAVPCPDGSGALPSTSYDSNREAESMEGVSGLKRSYVDQFSGKDCDESRNEVFPIKVSANIRTDPGFEGNSLNSSPKLGGSFNDADQHTSDFLNGSQQVDDFGDRSSIKLEYGTDSTDVICSSGLLSPQNAGAETAHTGVQAGSSRVDLNRFRSAVIVDDNFQLNPSTSISTTLSGSCSSVRHNSVDPDQPFIKTSQVQSGNNCSSFLSDSLSPNSTTFQENEYTVTKRGKYFQYNIDYQKYLVTNSAGQAECKFCGYAPTQKQILYQHIRQKHLMVEFTVCQICSKEFRLRSLYKIHLRREHSDTELADDSKATTCTECGRWYSSVWSLRRHMNTTHPFKRGTGKKSR